MIASYWLPVLGAVLYAIEGMIRRVTWNVEPADESAQALTEAVWLDGVLFKDMSRPFSSVISCLRVYVPCGIYVSPFWPPLARRPGGRTLRSVTCAQR